jgi:hypothetical protein
MFQNKILEFFRIHDGKDIQKPGAEQIIIDAYP